MENILKSQTTTPNNSDKWNVFMILLIFTTL